MSEAVSFIPSRGKSSLEKIDIAFVNPNPLDCQCVRHRVTLVVDDFPPACCNLEETSPSPSMCHIEAGVVNVVGIHEIEPPFNGVLNGL